MVAGWYFERSAIFLRHARAVRDAYCQVQAAPLWFENDDDYAPIRGQSSLSTWRQTRSGDARAQFNTFAFQTPDEMRQNNASTRTTDFNATLWFIYIKCVYMCSFACYTTTAHKSANFCHACVNRTDLTRVKPHSHDTHIRTSHNNVSKRGAAIHLGRQFIAYDIVQTHAQLRLSITIKKGARVVYKSHIAMRFLAEKSENKNSLNSPAIHACTSCIEYYVAT